MSAYNYLSGLVKQINNDKGVEEGKVQVEMKKLLNKKKWATNIMPTFSNKLI